MAEFCAVKKGPFKTTPIQHRTNCSEFKSAPPSNWGSMNCYQNDYGWKSSEDKVTTENHILSMIRSMNIIQIGKSSMELRYGVGISQSLSKLLIVHDGFLWCHVSYDGQFCGISLFLRLTVPSTPVILTVVEIESRRKNTPLLDIE